MTRQPIATAPLDTYVLLYTTDGSITVGKYDDQRMLIRLAPK